MKIIDLFSGIGGFSLAGHWMGWETELFCERDTYCQRVLKFHFPGVPIYNDVRTLLNEIDVQEYINNAEQFILTGGFPCQPFSVAGQQKGTEDDRHLWPAMFEIIKRIRPKWIIAENVSGLLTISGGMVFEQVCLDLESEAYKVQPFIIPACSKNAPHRRDRVWIIAYNSNPGIESLQQRENPIYETGVSPNSISNRQHKPWKPIKSVGHKKIEKWEATWATGEGTWPTQSPVCHRNDGLPSGLVDISFSKWRKETIKMLGNSIVPQIAHEIFMAIKTIEEAKS